MKVAINTLPFSRGGGLTYLKNVLPRLANTDEQYDIYVPEGREGLTDIEASNLTYRKVKFPTHYTLLRLFYEQVVFPLILFIRCTDVLYSPTSVTTLFAPCPTIITFQNISAYDPREEYSKRIKYRVQKHLARLSAKRSTAVIFVSEHSKNIIYPYLNVSEEKCHVIYHGVDESIFRDPVEPGNPLRERLLEHEPYLVYVSTINEHKNHHSLIDGYSRLPDELRKEFPLLLVGKNSNEEYYNMLKKRSRELGVADDVEFIGYVDYKYIPYVYQHALISVFPSRLETFGLPLIESMTAALPIAAADATVIPEIVDNAAELFDPDDPSDIAQKLKELLTDDEYRAKLADTSKHRAKQFTWDQTVKQTYGLLQQAGKE